MSKFGNGHGIAGFGLLIGGTLALVGYQQSAVRKAVAETDTLVDYHNLQPLREVQPVLSMNASMNAAIAAGQFEDIFKPTPVPTPTAVPTALAMPEPTVGPKPVVFESGVASTYGEGDGFEGNLTACGQVFRTNIVQVAHKSLPCGIMIRIEDADTGQTVDAEVTDRGPYIPDRIVDLSWGAFKQLDGTGPGLLHVNVYVLDAAYRVLSTEY